MQTIARQIGMALLGTALAGPALSGPRTPYAGKPGAVEVGALADLVPVRVEGDPTRDLARVADPAKNFRVIMEGGRVDKNSLDERWTLLHLSARVLRCDGNRLRTRGISGASRVHHGQSRATGIQ